MSSIILTTDQLTQIATMCYLAGSFACDHQDKQMVGTVCSMLLDKFGTSGAIPVEGLKILQKSFIEENDLQLHLMKDLMDHMQTVDDIPLNMATVREFAREVAPGILEVRPEHNFLDAFRKKLQDTGVDLSKL